jgi:hypothetical protein
VWHGYTKFAVERHPYDRVVSMWVWRTRDQEPRPHLRQFVCFLEEQKRSDGSWRGKGARWQLYSNWPIYTIGNEVVADHLIRWEEVAVELPQVVAEFGVNDLQLGWHRAGKRDPDATLDLLDDELRERVHDLYRHEFEALGFQP